jgi:hypothetical protein
MKKFIYLFLLFTGFAGMAGAQNMGQFTREEWNNANTAANAGYLTKEEKNVILYMNLARMDGKRFYDSFFQPYIEKYNSIYTPQITSKNKYAKSFKKDIYKIKELSPFYPNKKLSEASEYHAKDMGKTGKIGHNSTNGDNMEKRLVKFMKNFTFMAENCSYGPNEGLDIVMALLIDDGVSGVGHRKNTLNLYAKYAGVSIQPHKIFKFNCVIDFYNDK